MSWDGYIVNLLSDGILEKAAICGFRETVSVWAESANFGMTEEEMKLLATKDQTKFASNGVKLGGTKFMLVRNNLDDSDYACLQLRSGTTSATVAMTEKAFVIGVGKKDEPAGKVSSRLYETVKYLKGVGY